MDARFLCNDLYLCLLIPMCAVATKLSQTVFFFFLIPNTWVLKNASIYLELVYTELQIIWSLVELKTLD